ncbi:hypothetical protein BJX65DRAFT_16386 [Aspergillus insuetus]
MFFLEHFLVSFVLLPISFFFMMNTTDGLIFSLSDVLDSFTSFCSFSFGLFCLWVRAHNQMYIGLMFPCLLDSAAYYLSS